MDKYIKLDLLAKGCKSNTVYLVKNLDDNKLYALKRIIIDINNEEQMKQNKNEHTNIIRYYESFLHKDKLCIIMEYADGGDLSSVIKKNIAEKKQIAEDQIWIWFLQVCHAIEYIHSKKILHRDIKSQNIFLTKSGQAKLGDFGISKVLTDTMDFAKTSLGTPYFLSPEICSGNKYNFKTDLWMLGCVLFELCCLKKPFEGENFHVLPIPKNYSENLKYLISILLKKDPSKRPSIREILSLDFVVEKMRKLNFSITPPEKNKFSNNPVVNSPLNRSNHKCSSNSCNSCSPVNENHQNFYLFNLKFDNLLKGMHEDKEGTSSNSGSKYNSKSSSSNYEVDKEVNYYHNEANKFHISNLEGLNSHNLNSNPRHKKYSPSFSQVDYNRIIHPVQSHPQNKSRFISTDHIFEYSDNSNSNSNDNSNKAKIQFSHPQLPAKKPFNLVSPINMNQMNKPRHGRNHSMNCDASDKINSTKFYSNNNVTDNTCEPQIKKSFFSNLNTNTNSGFPPKGNVVHSIISKHLNNNKNETMNNSKVDSSSSFHTNNLGSYSNKYVRNVHANENSSAMANKLNININIDTDKYKKYKETLNKSHMKNQTKSIELDYFTEHEDKNNDCCNNFLMKDKSQERLDSHSTAIKTDTIEFRQKTPKQSETSYYLDKLISCFGENIVNSLIKLIENSSSPIKILKGDGKEIEKIVGKDYKAAQTYLVKIFIFDDNSLNTDRFKANA